jgi:hypothetical protein
MIDIESRIYDSRDDVKKLILSVINDEVKAVELPFNNIKHYIDICKTLDVEQYDIYVEKLWINVDFSKGEANYCLCGNLYDSKTLNFSISE